MPRPLNGLLHFHPLKLSACLFLTFILNFYLYFYDFIFIKNKNALIFIKFKTNFKLKIIIYSKSYKRRYVEFDDNERGEQSRQLDE